LIIKQLALMRFPCFVKDTIKNREKDDKKPPSSVK
jgi:hypothetical protein